MKRFGVNTVANLIARVWSLVSIYIFIPMYIDILGETAYGLVSFFATLQTALNLLGLGLSNTLRREFAAGENNQDNAIRKYKLLRSVELIYIVLGIVIILICSVGSDAIANNWLNIEELDPILVSKVISLMGISIALQLIANLYAGCLFGLEHQVLANSFCVGWSVVKYVGSLGILLLISPDLSLFYTWHILTDLGYMLILRIYSVKKLEIKTKVHWRLSDFSNIKDIWRYTCGILLISCVALINKQLDKIIISKFLTLTELGAYNVATTLGNLTSIVPAALFVAVFPRFTHYATTGNEIQLQKEFTVVNKTVNIFLSCMGAYVAVFALPLIKLWTGSNSYAGILGNVGMLVVLAITMAEFQEIPYALALANGNTKYNVLVGSVFIPIVLITTYIGIKYYGLVGAGIVYLLMMLGQTVLYEYLVIKKYLNKKSWNVLLNDTFLPLLISLVIAFGSRAFVFSVTKSAFEQSAFAVLCGGITLIFLYIFLAREEMKDFKKILRRKK